MKNNEKSQKSAKSILKLELLSNVAETGMTVQDGRINLSPNAGSLSQNTAPMTNSWKQKNDSDIEAEVRNAFDWNRNTSNDTIKVKVEDGWVTLSGILEWNYQKEAAKAAVGNLIGVKGIVNNIAIHSEGNIAVHKETIERALKSHVSIDARDIEVLVDKKTVTLKGSVDSWYQKELAGRIVWKAPGVVNVANELLVEEE